jgi:hypothetical protein
VSDENTRALADEILRQETALAEGRAVNIGGYLFPKAPGEPQCLISPVGCPTPRERDLLACARAMDFTLHAVRVVAESHARDGVIPVTEILERLGSPYRFPLPGDAEALEAYREAYGHGNRTIIHIAGCDVCEPAGRDGPEFCQAYEGAVRADHQESLRERGRG